MNEWGLQEVVEWWSGWVSEHQQKFVKEQISGEVLITLTEDSLKMGIKTKGHRVRIRDAIESLKRVSLQWWQSGIVLT